jgi:hypothetical protein
MVVGENTNNGVKQHERERFAIGVVADLTGMASNNFGKTKNLFNEPKREDRLYQSNCHAPAEYLQNSRNQPIFNRLWHSI